MFCVLQEHWKIYFVLKFSSRRLRFLDVLPKKQSVMFKKVCIADYHSEIVYVFTTEQKDEFSLKIYCNSHINMSVVFFKMHILEGN